MANQVVWAARSDNGSFLARYSPAGLTPGFGLQASSFAQPTYDADVNAIGGNRWNFDRSNTLNRVMAYPGQGIFNTQAISVLVRCAFGIVGGANMGLFELGDAAGFGANYLAMYAINNGGTQFDIRANVKNVNAQAGVSNVTLETFAPTVGQYYDLVFTWDGTTGANKFIYYRDAVSKATATSGQAWANPKDATITKYVAIGGGSGMNSTRNYYNEAVVWNYVITPSSVALVSGTGSLNGSSRTSFVDVASFDGTLCTGAGASNIKSGASEVIYGVTTNGTAGAGGSYTFGGG